MHYDSLHAPDPEQWLLLDEAERMLLVEKHHRRIRQVPPGLPAHVVIHVVVENQLAEGVEPVLATLDRLMREGLDRHDALHAIGSVLSEHLFRAVTEPSSTIDPSEDYHAGLRKLTAAGWRNSG